MRIKRRIGAGLLPAPKPQINNTTTESKLSAGEIKAGKLSQVGIRRVFSQAELVRAGVHVYGFAPLTIYGESRSRDIYGRPVTVSGERRVQSPLTIEFNSDSSLQNSIVRDALYDRTLEVENQLWRILQHVVTQNPNYTRVELMLELVNS